MHADDSTGRDKSSTEDCTTIRHYSFEWVSDTGVEPQSFFDRCLAGIKLVIAQGGYALKQ